VAREIVRALPARNLAIINGHGGNRGLLENLLHELRGAGAITGGPKPISVRPTKHGA